MSGAFTFGLEVVGTRSLGLALLALLPVALTSGSRSHSSCISKSAAARRRARAGCTPGTRWARWPARGLGLVLTSAAAVTVSLFAFAAAPRVRPWDPLVMTAGVYEYGLEWKDRDAFRLADLARERRILFYEDRRPRRNRTHRRSRGPRPSE